MILTILAITILCFSIVWRILDYKFCWDTDLGALVCLVFSIIFATLVVIFLLCGPASTRAYVKKFESVKLTIRQQRNIKLSGYERATLTKDIVERNADLAEQQFYAKNVWLSWFYDKSILNLTPIE